MGGGLSKPSHQSFNELHPQSRPRHRHPQEAVSKQRHLVQEHDGRGMQRSGNKFMCGSRQDPHAQFLDQEQRRYLRSQEEQHREEIHRLGEEYMENFWEDARRVQERVRAQNRKRFRLS